MTMAKADPEREERRRQQKEIADSLKESGALDEIFARIDAGEPLTGQAGLGLVMSLHTTYAMAKPFKPEWNDRPLFEHQHVKKVIAAEKNALQLMPHILANSQAIVDDLTALEALWRRRFDELPAGDREKARQIRFLQTRGFAVSAILKLLRELPR